MKRFHVHVAVDDLAANIRFYSTVFGAQPTVQKPDYAKWMLDDPRVNFAISNTGRAPGIDHLGLQVDSGEELATLGKRLDAAGGTVVPEEATTFRWTWKRFTSKLLSCVACRRTPGRMRRTRRSSSR